MKIILLIISLLPNLCLAKDIIRYGYKITIPDKYTVVYSDVVEGKETAMVINNKKQLILSFDKQDKTNPHFFPLRYYRMDTHRNLFYGIFGDQPTTNKAVLEYKSNQKNYDLEEFEISKNSGFVFFRINNSGNKLGETVFLVSTPIDDEVLNIYFSKRTDEKLIKSVINSLEVNH